MERGERIKVLREAKGWNQDDLVRSAQAHGEAFRTTSYLSKIESGDAGNPGILVLDAIAAALEVSDSAVLTHSYDAEIERDAAGFVTRQSLEMFIANEKISEEDAAALRTMCREVGGPKDVDGWKTLFSYLGAYTKAQFEVGTRGRRISRSSRRGRT